MRFSELGALRVSVVGIGASKLGGQLDAEATRSLLDAGLEAGINLLDTADVYGGQGESERVLGAALQGRRERAVIATKFGMDWTAFDTGPRLAPGSRAAIRRAVEGSLRRLQTDWIDLYQYHLPDGVTPIAETLEALAELVREGKVREIGCANFTAPQLEDAASAGPHRFASLQTEYSLLHRDPEADLIPVCRRQGVRVVPYFPLASGLLTGKYGREEAGPSGVVPDRLAGPGGAVVHDGLDDLRRFAGARGLSCAEVAIGWLAAQPAVVSVIAGATSPEQVQANARAADWVPSATDLAELDAIFVAPGRAVSRARQARRRVRGARRRVGRWVDRGAS